MNAPPALAIHRLCSRAAAREPVIARLALTALASDVADSLASLPVLPPQSLLLLRHMRLAVPGLSLERIPDSGVRADASRLARKQVADACAHAARPAHEAVSDLAPAVLFGDEAELLACLARDALAGRLDHWWWRALLGRHYPDWQVAWQQRPQATAGALRLLARAGLEATVLAALGKDERPHQAKNEIRSASPPAPAVAADSVPVPTAASEGTRQRPGFAPSPDAGSSEPLLASAPAFAPVAKLAGQAQLPASSSTAASPPGTVSVATHPTCALAETGAAASASTDPANAAFTERLPVTDEGDRNAAPPAKAALLLPAGVRDATRSPPHAPAANLAGTRAPQAHLPKLTAPPRSVRFIDDEISPPPRPPVASVPSPRPAATASPQPSAGDAQRSKGPMSEPGSAEPSHHEQSDIGDTPARPHDQALAPPPPLAAPPQAIASRHARLFFLVNILLGDGLYPDFTRPADPGFPLPIWQLLALLGDSLLGASLRDDPLRPLLERLAAELPDRSTGNDCNFARDWPLPGSLPDSLPAKRPWRLRRDGFAHWFACYRQSLRSRLAQALAVPPALAGRAIVQDDGQALLWVSEASLVVVHQLDRHPVAWRLAGLDRDPGYLPSAGRSLRFVFE